MRAKWDRFRSLCGRRCHGNHFKIAGETDQGLLEVGKGEDLMVVMFEQTEEYRIMAKSELTPELWVEKPYVT